MSRWGVFAGACLSVWIGTAADLAAQVARPASVRIVVHDATDLPIAAAEVSLTAADGAALTVVTSVRGEALFENVRPGTYKAAVTSNGFDPVEIADLSVRAGQRVTRAVGLTIAGFIEELDVAPAAADQRLRDSFTSQLTPEQLSALPQDPEELAIVLQQLLGDDADIRVDGFSGGRLPPGTQIQDVRVRYDAGSASSGGGPRVEIRTMPGGDRWRSNASVSVRDESLNARNAFSGDRPAGQTRQYSWNLNGPIAKGKTGLALSIDGSKSVENQTIRAAAPGGIFAHLVEQPSSRLGGWARLEHAFNPAQTIRVDVSRNGDEAHNQGLGEFDLPERAFAREGSSGELRVNHHATLRRRYVNDLRFTYGWFSSASVPLSDARTVRVLDAFTSGGAQVQGGRFWKEFELEDEIEVTVKTLHQITASLSVDSTRYHGDEYRNAAGTYTFSSLAAFDAGLPTTFTQRVGDPRYQYSMTRFSWHVQDDYRIRKNLMLNLGVRHDFQTHLSDWANVSPRVGTNWTPSARTRTTLRGSVGVAHSMIDAGTYQQTLLVNGLQQRDLVISSPGYPDPYTGGVTRAAAPPSLIRAGSNLVMPYNIRLTAGVDQPFGKIARFRATYSHQNGHHVLRSRDANAPVNGARPDPAARNVTELETSARTLNESIELDLSVNYPPRRFSGNVNYAFGQAMSEADGAFSLPPDSIDVSNEWGPSRNDIRHRLNASVTTDLAAGFRVNAGVRAQSAAPYTITTGTDANGDGVNNERPAGVGRNSARGAATRNVDLTLTWGLRLGQRAGVETPRGGGGDQRRQGGAPPAASRNNELFRFETYVRANNVLNAVNPQNFSGVLTSPFFGQPTSVAAARRVVIGTRVWF